MPKRPNGHLEKREGSMKEFLRPKDGVISGGAPSVWGTLCILIALLANLAGCGGSESTDSSVVTPPTSTVLESAAPAAGGPPGGIEMPSGEIPSPTADDSPEAQGGGIELPAGVELPTDSGALSQPEIKYGTWEEIQSVAKSSGRITVVDLWSLACEPCLKEFPGLVRLHQSLGSSVQCIAVDIDFDGRKTRPPEHYEERVISFLSSVGAAGFPTFISQTPSDDIYAAAKLASIPAVLIYSAEGEIVKVFVDAGETVGFTYEKDVIPLVTELAG
jgi:thiol-disulfide isomerase/thioredoxin